MEQVDKILLILNPIAGKGKAGEREPEIERLMAGEGLSFDIVRTERAGHATGLAGEAGPRGYGIVVAAGGDGTVNEVVNGLMAASLSGKPVPALGVLAVGRGNDFAYGADLPGTLEECVDVLAAGARRPLDVGLVRGGDYPDGKYFANGIGIGFDTIVGLEAAKMKRVHGFMAYVLGALKTFVMYPAAPYVRLVYDGGVIEQTSHQISIMNGKRMGGTFFMAPDAENHDGRLELCMADSLSRGAMIRLMACYTKGTQAGMPGIQTASSTRYEIEAPSGGLIVHADGETICTNGFSLVVECLAGRLSIICDPGRVARLRAGAKGAA